MKIGQDIEHIENELRASRPTGKGYVADDFHFPRRRDRQTIRVDGRDKPRDDG
jgi:hypothetical protein